MLDILAAIAGHLQRGPIPDGLVFDAVRVEIGGAVQDLDGELLGQQPRIPWAAAPGDA